MSKLQHEIVSNNAQVNARLMDTDDKKKQRRELVDSMLDNISGGFKLSIIIEM